LEQTESSAGEPLVHAAEQLSDQLDSTGLDVVADPVADQLERRHRNELVHEPVHLFRGHLDGGQVLLRQPPLLNSCSPAFQRFTYACQSIGEIRGMSKAEVNS